MKNLFICIVALSMLLAFAIGLMSGLIVIKIQSEFDRQAWNNLLIIYSDRNNTGRWDGCHVKK